MSAPELKPCPFCGSAAEFGEGRTGDDKKWPYIACSKCEAIGPYLSSADTSPFDESYNQELISEKWNTRADISAARIAELEAENARLQALLDANDAWARGEPSRPPRAALDKGEG